MPLEKPIKDLNIAILLPCYKRIEYTKKCIKALVEAQEYRNVTFVLVDDASHDGTIQLLRDCELGDPKHGSKYTILHRLNEGLRHTIIDFFEWIKMFEKSSVTKFDMIGLLGNDVLMPKNWLNDMLKIFEKSPAHVLSPNYLPSNPAFNQGREDKEGHGFRPAIGTVGIWVMYACLISGIEFERHSLHGIYGSINLLQQIKMEKDPIIGWVPTVMAQDIGHWSGAHPEHIKSDAHLDYYAEVGRGIKW